MAVKKKVKELKNFKKAGNSKTNVKQKHLMQSCPIKYYIALTCYASSSWEIESSLLSSEVSVRTCR